ncbi:MAG: hypothetical protein DID90_2727553198 [Candidatus Nitrotoga sp. LAW]|nr:MAG: hypothetical protein DID90_2727553198 [Candidatus Nitrotoga sp. LAW]
MRTTKGNAGDYGFDQDFQLTRKCGEKVIADDNLHGATQYTIDHKVPVLFTLNDGIWAAATCDVPKCDINDKLEQDKNNCRWNEKNKVVPDDSLKKLSGSMESPELGRALTFNIYAVKNRLYKKRNLQRNTLIF